MTSQITGVSIVCSTVCSGADRSNKTSKLHVTGLCAGNSPVTSEFPAQRTSNTENVSTWWRHHADQHYWFFTDDILSALLCVCGKYFRGKMTRLYQDWYYFPVKVASQFVYGWELNVKKYIFASFGLQYDAHLSLFTRHRKKQNKNWICIHDDVIKWKHFPRYWPFVWGIHRSAVDSLQKGQWRETLMLSLICAWTNGWVNNRDAGELRRHRAHYDVIVMGSLQTMTLPINPDRQWKRGSMRRGSTTTQHWSAVATPVDTIHRSVYITVT